MARFTVPAVIAAASVAAPARAAETAMLIPDSGDTGWLLGASLLAILTLIPGLLLALIGLRGWAHAPRMVIASAAAIALATLLFFAVGFSLMFDVTAVHGLSSFIGGASNIMLNNMGTVREGTTLPETGFVIFQLVFLLAAVTLINAALANRARQGWLLGFSGLWVLLVAVPVGRWMWGGGWLGDTGALDMTGGITIFISAGFSVVAAAALINRRQSGATAVMADGGTQLIGAFLTMVGIMALAGAATLGASDNAAVAILAIVTAAMTGALAMAAFERRLDAAAMASGLLAGSIGIATAGDGVSVGAAWLMGIAAAAALKWGPALVPGARLARTGGGIGGIIAAATTGALLFGIFLSFETFGGSGYAEGMTMGGQIIAQLIAILAVAGWSVFGTLIAALMAGLVLPMTGADADGGR